MKKTVKQRVRLAVFGLCTVLAAAFAAPPVQAAVPTASTYTFGDEIIDSEYCILINAAQGTIAARKNEKARMNPASMTKIMTVLAAADHVRSLDDRVTITQDIIDHAAATGCTRVGYEAGDRPSVRDLFYGTILPSGADAAIALGRYCAGSDEAFVAMMNQKAASLGMLSTHFENCVGLYDENHYSTAEDMAVLLLNAATNPLCLQVLSARNTKVGGSASLPGGISLTNLFLTRIDGLSLPGKVYSAKTGYVSAAGYCAASFYISSAGVPFICVTGKADSSMNAVFDHTMLYACFAQ